MSNDATADLSEMLGAMAEDLMRQDEQRLEALLHTAMWMQRIDKMDRLHIVDDRSIRDTVTTRYEGNQMIVGLKPTRWPASRWP